MRVEINTWYTNSTNGRKCMVAGFTSEYVFYDYRENGVALKSCRIETFNKFFIPITSNN